ncbi:hypothetical protein PR048_016615 [Dryococelus australis]|uniref:Uncharacterized protein n=1 Tax=Dryococelus australis TaxID=614101 RepID=A0ABQ9H7B7_9NEOP|nr:hypothetical protein PR048_016615 [Dryococelus australis]
MQEWGKAGGTRVNQQATGQVYVHQGEVGRESASIHTSRGFGGYQGGTALRWPGVKLHVVGPLLALWAAATLLHGALLVQAVRTLARSAPHDLLVLAAVELGLALATVATAAAALLVDCHHDPD